MRRILTFPSMVIVLFLILLFHYSVSWAVCYCEGECLCTNGYVKTKGPVSYLGPCIDRDFCNWACAQKGLGSCLLEYVRCDEKSTGCVAEEIYGENSEEVALLRYLRDNLLAQTPAGQEIIRLYYELSPAIVQIMEEDEVFKAQVKEMVNGVLESIGKEG